MRPITKKYHSKDLNIAYNDGLEKGKFESRQLPEVVRMCEMAKEKALKEELKFLESDKIKHLVEMADINACHDDYEPIVKRIAKIKKELGR